MTDQRHTPKSHCPICSSEELEVFLELSQVPAQCNLLFSTRREALRATRGDIRLGLCGECGHITNLVFNPDLVAYDGNYENSLHFSPRFTQYATTLAARLIERHGLRGKDIIDIGCGTGEFLELLCILGDNRGIGFDPSCVRDATSSGVEATVRFIRDAYSERYAANRADLFCCRQMLEHLHDPNGFLSMLRRAIGSRLSTVVFFEVPNARLMLRDLGIWDIIYEHCSYFSMHSVARAFTSCGFAVQDLTEAFDGQFLCIEATPGHASARVTPDQPDAIAELACEVGSFAGRYREMLAAWRHTLQQIERAGKRAVVWGAGSKGVSFLNALKIRDQIEYVVDINPRKQGRYVAGAGQAIVAPECLRGYRPDVVIVMNSVYQPEIRQLVERLGLPAVEFITA